MSTENLKKVRGGFAERLVALRKARNLSQPELAKAVGVSNGAVGYWEIGRSEPKGAILLELAKVLDTTPHYLLNGEIAPPEGDGAVNETARWKDRALAAEQKLAKIEKTAAGLLAELAGESVTVEGKPKPKAAAPEAKKISSSEAVAAAFEEAASSSVSKPVSKGSVHKDGDRASHVPKPK